MAYFSNRKCQFVSLSFKFCLLLVNFLAGIGWFLTWKCPFLSIIFKFCLILVDFLTNILIEMYNFTIDCLNFVRHFSIFWLELAYFLNINGQFFSLTSTYCLQFSNSLAEIGWFWIMLPFSVYPNFVWYWSIFWRELAYFSNGSCTFSV